MRYNRKPVLVLASTNSRVKAEEVFPTAESLSFALGFTYNSAATALMWARFAGKNQAQLRGVTFGFLADHTPTVDEVRQKMLAAQKTV